MTKSELATLWDNGQSSTYSWKLPREIFSASSIVLGPGLPAATYCELYGKHDGQDVKMIVAVASRFHRYFRFVKPDFDLGPHLE